MSAVSVVITRPRAQAEPLAARITAMGLQAHVLPLLEIHPLQDDRLLLASLHSLSEYALVAFVSPNAIQAVFSHSFEWPRGVDVAVIGESSRQALVRVARLPTDLRIFSPKDPARTDSETLLEVLDLPALRGRKVLIMRAETGRELLADRLREAGVVVDQVAVYRRHAPRLDAPFISQLKTLLALECDWLITSSEALRYLHQNVLTLGGQEAWAHLCQQRLIVPHQRIADSAQEIGCEHILLTGSGDDALIAALQSRT